MFEWDEKKSEECRKARGFNFSIVSKFDFETAATKIDNRKNYGEIRYRSLGTIDGLLYSVTWTPRSNKVRIISVRRAREKERKQHG